ncbi:MAG TPA: glycosyltransferase [Vicinamibacterales bacterium]|nr:glycosyltransferase [Vicinamibacterales bacterium]
MNGGVSIVIPCFNQARFLVHAMASARQSVIQPEIIVVDDGSTDETSETARAAGVTCIRQSNRGLVAARNRGLEAASGAFVIFLDADDTLLPGAIDVGLAALTEDADRALAWGRCVMMDETGVLLPTPSPPRVLADHHAALLASNCIWTPGAAMLRTEAVRTAGGFAGGFDAAADYDLYLRITRVHGACDHGQPVVGYRRHAANMSGNAARMLRDTLAVVQRNRPDAGPLLDAWQRGRRMWQDFYGTQLVEEMRHDLRTGALTHVVGKSFVLARMAPAVLWREARRKGNVVMRRRQAGRATAAADTASPSRRADSASGS